MSQLGTLSALSEIAFIRKNLSSGNSREPLAWGFVWHEQVVRGRQFRLR